MTDKAAEAVLSKIYDTKPRASNDFDYNVILNTDSRLFNPMLVLISSMACNFKNPINLYILQSDFVAHRRIELASFCESFGVNLNIIDIDTERFKEFIPGRLPKAGSFYLLAHELLPAECDRALYIDIDTVVLKDLTDFYNVDLEDAWLAACQEYDNSKVRDYIQAKKEGKETVFEPFYCSDCLFNAGVQVLNLSKLRRERVTLNDYIKLKNPKDVNISHLVIQPIVNRFAQTDIKLFPKLYFNCWSAHEEYFRKCFRENKGRNEVYSYYELDETYVNSIVHFTAFPSLKPWNALERIDADGRLEFARNLNKFQEIHTREWWDYAKLIPAKNYGELVGASIARYANGANKDLLNYLSLKLVNEMTKKTLPLPRGDKIHPEWKYIQYPFSENNHLHFEYYLSGDGMAIALHLEGSLNSKEGVVRAVMKKDRELQIWQKNFGVGCYYLNNDIGDINKSVYLMQKLMELSLPVLQSNSLLK